MIVKDGATLDAKYTRLKRTHIFVDKLRKLPSKYVASNFCETGNLTLKKYFHF